MKEISGKTNVIGVIGNPIEHTLSPVIHNTLCSLMGIDAVYVPLKVESDIESAVKGLSESGVYGLNVTVPFKRDVMKALSSVDEEAAEIGAVNTLVRSNGGYKGYNTDMQGLLRALEAKKVELSGKKAIVIGAGGAHRHHVPPLRGGRQKDLRLDHVAALAALAHQIAAHVRRLVHAAGVQAGVRRPIEGVAGVVGHAPVHRHIALVAGDLLNGPGGIEGQARVRHDAAARLHKDLGHG